MSGLILLEFKLNSMRKRMNSLMPEAPHAAAATVKRPLELIKMISPDRRAFRRWHDTE